jgi:hypothetical protein
MLSSGIIDLAIGLAFIFGVTAALGSVITELVARFLGLRGAYLLLGLRELVDGQKTPVVLNNAETDYRNARDLITGADRPEGSAPPGKPLSATSVLLGSPILSSQGMTGNISSRHLTVDGTKVTAVAVSKDVKPAAPTTPDESTATANGGPAAAPEQKASRWSAWKMRRSLPSYISSRSFAEAVVNLVLPDKNGQTSMDNLRTGMANLAQGEKGMPASMGPLMTSLQSLASSADGDITKFRTAIEHWYDDHMDRVSGWYKRRTALITLVAGGIIVLLLNVNAITIGRALYSDSATRTAVSTAAAAGNPCPAPSSSPSPGPASSSSSPDEQSCLANLERQVSDVAQAGLPLGWSVVPACVPSSPSTSTSTAPASGAPKAKCDFWERYGITTAGDGSWWQFLLAFIGFAVTIAALTPGAQFWFGLVVKLNSLRSSGPPPASSTS